MRTQPARDQYLPQIISTELHSFYSHTFQTKNKILSPKLHSETFYCKKKYYLRNNTIFTAIHFTQEISKTMYMILLQYTLKFKVYRSRIVINIIFIYKISLKRCLRNPLCNKNSRNRIYNLVSKISLKSTVSEIHCTSKIVE